jgi:hypothetical protein
MMKQGWLIGLICMLAAGCAGAPKHDRPPAASFEGKLSEVVVPADVLGGGWTLEKGLVVDDVSDPPKVSPLRKAWADRFFKQRQAYGVRSYGEFFYYNTETPPVKISTLILVYQNARRARTEWDDTYGPGLLLIEHRRTNEFGDKSVQGKKINERVVLAGNVVIQVSQPVPGDSNVKVLKAWMSRLGLDQPSTQPAR